MWRRGTGCDQEQRHQRHALGPCEKCTFSPSPTEFAVRTPGDLPTPAQERLRGNDLGTLSPSVPAGLGQLGLPWQSATDWLDKQKFTVLEAGSPRSRCWWGWFSWGLSPWFADAPSRGGSSAHAPTVSPSSEGRQSDWTRTTLIASFESSLSPGATGWLSRLSVRPLVLA